MLVLLPLLSAPPVPTQVPRCRKEMQYKPHQNKREDLLKASGEFNFSDFYLTQVNKNDNFNIETKTLLVFTFLRTSLKFSVDFQHISNGKDY